MDHFKTFIIYLLLILLLHDNDAEEYNSGAEYLQTAIRDIVIKNSERNIVNLIDSEARIVNGAAARRHATPSSSVFFDGNRRFSGGEHQDYPPDPPLQSQHHAPSTHTAQGTHGIPEPPALTKGELAALYEAAVSNGHAVHMSGPGVQDSVPVQAALHEIRDTTVHHQVADGSADSYYYYYYPLKSFMDGIPAHVPKPKVPKDHYKAPVLTSYNTHMHNVKVEPIQTIAEPPGKGKALEPLFMAISSFVGMAVMFMFSMVLLPRLTGGIKGATKNGKGSGGGGGGKAKNNIRNNIKNNINNNKNKKKPRLFQDENLPKILSDLIGRYSCTNCRPGEIEAYRQGNSRSKK